MVDLLLAQSLRTANFLLINQTRLFAWGTWDCNIFVAELLDHVHDQPGSRVQHIQGKYTTRLGAARFQAAYTAAPVWLAQQGYHVATRQQAQDHDIVLVAQGPYWHASLMYAGIAWTVLEGSGLAATNLTSDDYLIARKQHG